MVDDILLALGMLVAWLTAIVLVNRYHYFLGRFFWKEEDE